MSGRRWSRSPFRGLTGNENSGPLFWHKRISRVFDGLFKGLSNKLQIGFKRVSRIFQGFFLAVSRWIPECFKGLSRQFQGVSCFMALVAGTRAEGGLVISECG